MHTNISEQSNRYAAIELDKQIYIAIRTLFTT